MSQNNRYKFCAGLGLGAAAGYVLMQQAWVLYQLLRRDVQQSLETHRNRGQPWLAYEARKETHAYHVSHTIDHGIERVTYTPKNRRFATPLLMQHGMWHGAWCWAPWQALFAEWGWVSVAHSLPGHAGSPPQRPIPLCTLDYYLGFFKSEIERQSVPPVLMGHSMGGALVQWYLKYVRDDLPAAVLVAPWAAHSMINRHTLVSLVKLDPYLIPLMMKRWDAWPFVRTPARAARFLLSPQALVTPEALHARLGSESALVLLQHNPPFWYPAAWVQTPLLWLAGEVDAALPEVVERRAAAHYAADYAVIPNAGHNLMMEPGYRETARDIHAWLLAQKVP